MSREVYFKLIPKVESGVQVKPLGLMSIGTTSVLGNYFSNALGNRQVTVSRNLLDTIQDSLVEDSEILEDLLERRREAMKCVNSPSQEVIDTFLEDDVTQSRELKLHKDAIDRLQFIRQLVTDLEFSDFEEMVAVVG